MVDEINIAKEKLAKDIIGEIVLSENPERILKKWRNIFDFSQKKVAGHLGITSSVISDYECISFFSLLINRISSIIIELSTALHIS